MSQKKASPGCCGVGLVRILFPIVVLALALATWLIASNWPNRETDSSSLSIAKMLALIIATALLFLWALRMPGWKRRHVWASFLVVFGLALLAFKPNGMLGNFFALWVRRDWVMDIFFDGSDATLLERHRDAQTKADGAADLTARPGDWISFRGPGRDGIATGITISRNWNASPPTEVWRQPVGGGYAAFAAANGYLVTIEQRRDREVVVCYEANTGREVWATGWNTRFEESLGGPGPRATPTIFNGHVFAYGAKGRLVCLNGKDGLEKWAIETLRDNSNVQWAMSGSPLVVDDLVIVNPGAQTDAAKGKAVRAYNRLDGQVVWTAGNHPAGYSSPQLSTLGGVKQVLIFDAAGVAGHDVAKGTELWRFGFPTYQGINVAQPVPIDDSTVFIGAGYNTGGALLRVKQADGKWSVSEVWRTKTTVMRLKFSSGVRRKTEDGDYLYGLNDELLECLDLKTGKAKWKDDRRAGKGDGFGHGQIVLIDDLIVALTQFGELVLVEANPNEFKELGRIQALNRGHKTWNNPTVVGNRIIVRNDAEMACYELTGK